MNMILDIQRFYPLAKSKETKKRERQKREKESGRILEGRRST